MLDDQLDSVLQTIGGVILLQAQDALGTAAELLVTISEWHLVGGTGQVGLLGNTTGSGLTGVALDAALPSYSLLHLAALRLMKCLLSVLGARGKWCSLIHRSRLVAVLRRWFRLNCRWTERHVECNWTVVRLDVPR